MANKEFEFPVNLDAVSGREFVPPTSGDPRRDKWIQWLSAIDKDLTSLAINRMVWHAFTTVWRERKSPLPPSFLFAAIGNQYATTQAVGIRRQADRRRDVASLEALLRELVSHPQLVSRQFFVGRYEWGNQWLGDRQFSSLDPRGQGHLDPAIPAADQSELRKAATTATQWVDKHIAHLSVKPSTKVPTYSEIDQALEVMSRLFRRWTALLTGVDRDTEPAPQYDWLAPLRVPWIVDPRIPPK